MNRIRSLIVLGLALAAGLIAPAVRAAPPLETGTPGELRVAYRTDDKPISFLQDGQPAGLLIDLTNSIAERLGLHVTYVSTTFAAMVPAVRNHLYDTAAFGVLVTPERQAVVNFTSAIGYGQAQLVSRKSASLAKLEDAAGKTVAVTTGSALIPLLQQIAPRVTVKQFPNIASSINALVAGQIDGLFTGLATAERVVEQHPDLVATQTVESGVNALPVAKDRPGLLAALDRAIAAAMKDGTYTRLFTKWNPPTMAIPERLFSDYPGMPRPAAR
ncbi:MAG: amino acid ABC transporter substrate-binding protein [Burkholderiales bacterium]|nr:amino acid ABC transporter substrate-binding protein [Burkholderiales bacterium]MDE2275694.1 amino acid ABC transporter substrate-binding protein [Burkholderiales bacterium]